ncbi:MAG: periplasmic heavy metal sensor [Acidobacteriota bacterium]|jgi:Spy/CpxP family protein refolding chaperone
MKRALVVLAILALAVPAMAEVAPPRLGPPPPSADTLLGQLGLEDAQGAQMRPERAREIVVRFLELTEAQQAQWDALLDQLKAALEPLRLQLEDVRKQLAEELRKPNPDRAKIAELILRGKEIQEQMETARRAYAQAFEAMLTPEQQAKLAFLRRAQQVVPLLPAFQLYGLLPPLPNPPGR